MINIDQSRQYARTAVAYLKNKQFAQMLPPCMAAIKYRGGHHASASRDRAQIRILYQLLSEAFCGIGASIDSSTPLGQTMASFYRGMADWCLLVLPDRLPIDSIQKVIATSVAAGMSGPFVEQLKTLLVFFSEQSAHQFVYPKPRAIVPELLQTTQSTDAVMPAAFAQQVLVSH